MNNSQHRPRYALRALRSADLCGSHNFLTSLNGQLHFEKARSFPGRPKWHILHWPGPLTLDSRCPAPLLACDCPQLDGAMAPTFLLLLLGLLWFQRPVSGERSWHRREGIAFFWTLPPCFSLPNNLV